MSLSSICDTVVAGPCGQTDQAGDPEINSVIKDFSPEWAYVKVGENFKCTVLIVPCIFYISLRLVKEIKSCSRSILYGIALTDRYMAIKRSRGTYPSKFN